MVSGGDVLMMMTHNNGDDRSLVDMVNVVSEMVVTVMFKR